MANSFKGPAGLIVAIAVVLAVLVAFPAYRWFLAISILIGVIVAAILYFWHKLRPVREEDVEDKRPLKLE
jgi:xanthine/uracil permease